MPFPTRSGKYNATKVKDGGHTFDSKAEHRRWCELNLLLRAGEIFSLDVHPKLELRVGGKLIATYEGDFAYIEQPSKQIVWEDVKGVETDVFKIKRLLIGALYPDIDLGVIPVGRVR